MNSTFKLVFFLALSLLFSGLADAQTLEIENTYKLTGKSKRGALGDVTYDPAAGTYTLTYVTKSNDKKAKFQIYTFDNDFKFINMEEDEIEFEKAKTKYTWFNFNGELYTTEGLYVEPNLMGTLVLRKKKITHKYDWFFLGYYKDVEILKKVKPKTDDGRKYHYYSHAEDDVTGDVLILCGIKDKINKDADAYRHSKEFVVLRYNYDVELVSETSFSFDHPMTPVFSRFIGNDMGGVDGMSFVFAPMGGPGMNKVADPNKNHFSYLRVNSSPEIVDNISFDSYAPYWKIDEMVIDENNDVYLLGPSAMGKDKYYNQLVNTSKFKAVQLLKISDHKVAYFTETALEEFELKLKKPADQKKSPSYAGKKFQIANYKVGSAGDFFVAGQNFSTSKEGNKYKDILGFHFDNKGNLKSQYSIDTKESNKYSKAAGTEQFFIESADGSKMFWFQQEIVGVSLAKGKMLSYPSMGHIKVKEGNISNFTAFGGDEGYFLDPAYPFLETDKGNSLVFFGSDKKGKEIWFARVKLN